MHFKTIERDKILPMIEQAKDAREQKKILCDLLDCNMKELEALIKELRHEKEVTAKVAHDDELAEIAAYAKKLEGELADKEKELAKLESGLGDKLKEAQREAEERAKEASVLKERSRDYLSQMIKKDEKIEILSIALSRSLEFIASLNAVIAEVLKHE